jgi:hypothetical protein
MTGLIDNGQFNEASFLSGKALLVTNPASDLGSDGNAFSGIVDNLA